MENIERRRRLEQLLGLAQTYQGWSRKKLGKALGRDPSRLVPESGVPKLDLVMLLSHVLDWPTEDITQFIWDSYVDVDDLSCEPDPALHLESEAASRAAHRSGLYMDAVSFAKRAYRSASNAEERALACNREAMGWDGMGRFALMREVLQRGLQQADISLDVRSMLEVNLANAYYCQWQLIEAASIAQSLICRYEAAPPTDRLNRAVDAFAYYLRGHARRRQLATDLGRSAVLGAQARSDLIRSQQLHDALAVEFDDGHYSGIARTCAGGLLEVDVALGMRTARDAMLEIEASLEDLIDPTTYDRADWLESHGWWCIFGCNIALRHVSDEQFRQQKMAVFTNKADELGDVLDNWSLRERVFTMEFHRKQRLSDWTGMEPTWTMDAEDIRIMTGTMGRFPAFQDMAWKMLAFARVAT